MQTSQAVSAILNYSILMNKIDLFVGYVILLVASYIEHECIFIHM